MVDPVVTSAVVGSVGVALAFLTKFLFIHGKVQLSVWELSYPVRLQIEKMNVMEECLSLMS